jgi:hypothetical protein
MGKKSGSGSKMNNPDHISSSLETIFWVKILKSFHEEPGSAMEKIRIRDPGWKKHCPQHHLQSHKRKETATTSIFTYNICNHINTQNNISTSFYGFTYHLIHCRTMYIKQMKQQTHFLAVLCQNHIKHCAQCTAIQIK